MKLIIHSKGIVGSRSIEPGEAPSAMVGCILEINGQLIDRVTRVTTEFTEDFATFTITCVPGDIEVIGHTRESWDVLCKALK